MGFAHDLQSQSAHEALLTLQDAELRLLENFKRCMQLRIKCDREYAIALNSVHIHAQKIDQNVDLTTSTIAKVWHYIMEETERFSKLIKANADALATNTLDKVTLLISEKRTSRKWYQEERNRIEGELSQLKEIIHKQQNEYEKCLDNFHLMKAKYDDQCTKGKTCKKLDETKEKYRKACKKLHKNHNEYVLTLCEASVFEESFRNHLLPSLLTYQQIVQEDIIEQCKNVLQEYINYCNHIPEEFELMHKTQKEAVDTIMADKEYEVFLEVHKGETVESQKFQFAEELLEEYSGNLQANELVLNDMTVDNLKARFSHIEHTLADCKQTLERKQKELNKFHDDLQLIVEPVDEISKTVLVVKKRALDTLTREVTVLQCEEKKLQKMHDLLQKPIKALGEDDPPKAIEFIDPSPSGSLEKSDRSSSFYEGSISITLQNVKTRILSAKSRMQKRNTMTNPPPLPDKDFQASTGSSPVSSDGYTEMILNPNRPLSEEEWFHGILPRDEVQRLLTNNGDYLLRETSRLSGSQYVLSVCWNGHRHFIVQVNNEGFYRFEGPAFPTVQELIIHQHKSGLPVTTKSGAILLNPSLREKWELSNSDVELKDKIGRGNFGDVYRAILKSKNMDVAVKTCRITLPEEQKKKFLQEGSILKQYDHQNIVKFIGICTQKQPIMIVMELVSGGSLLNFLRKNGIKQPLLDKVRMCDDTSAGMAYLESKNCIHRDLAARNCLVGVNNIVKISDFGMSREEEEYTVSDGLKQIPIKWTAPEALNYGRYTSLCDVWSYGILMWEVFTNGSTPYSGMTNTQAREHIESGYRLPAPADTPESVYLLMLKCWEYDPEQRLHFKEIGDELKLIRTDLQDMNS